MRTKVDNSSSSALAICACGARFLAVNRTAALRRAAQHEETAHPGDRNARDLYYRALRTKQRRNRRGSRAGSKHGNQERVPTGE